jgi:nitrogen fixation-related uncharacterized protein
MSWSETIKIIALSIVMAAIGAALFQWAVHALP